MDNDLYPTQDITVSDMSELYSIVKNTMDYSNKHLLKIIFEKYQLNTHILMIKKYLLLGQGDFVLNLLDLLDPQQQNSSSFNITLNTLPTNIKLNNIEMLLQMALRSSNAIVII